ncbi:MAG: hypothetical protein A3F41_03660 [Coxiella sp. RIFCSPHIGHO2_12_FULL_44_14]|nr:MAG: hypothetical protein A3F41_03660 [Coxiella sp. RIFCSPHIGHO2_12_FULL_44_14]
MKEHKDYDIIVIGAGLVGVSLVVALQNQGLRIALLENHIPIASPPSFDIRPLSLSYGSVLLLRTMGIWEGLESLACPIETVHVSQQGALGALHFRASEHGVPALGYVVPLGELQRVLYQRAASQTSVDIIPLQTITSVHTVAQTVHVDISTVTETRTLQANLCIAADGTDSTVRQLLTIGTVQRNPSETALTAELHFSKSLPYCAYERLTREGVWALLPLKNPQRCRLVWSAPQEKIEAAMHWDEETLRVHVQQIFAGYLPPLQTLQRGAVYPVRSVHATELGRPGIILLGNAAHTLYPLLAQGFNLGLRDAVFLAEKIMQARAAVRSLGDEQLLHEYEAARRVDQRWMRGLTLGMHGVSEWQWPFLNRGWGLGLLAIDGLWPVKKRLAARLMGLRGRQPLLKGVPNFYSQGA